MIKKIASAVWTRVVLSYKSTLVGLALGAAVIALQATVEQLQTIPASWAQALAAILLVVGASLKSKALNPAP